MGGGDLYCGYDDSDEMMVSKEIDYCFWRVLLPVYDYAGKECVVSVVSNSSREH